MLSQHDADPLQHTSSREGSDSPSAALSELLDKIDDKEDRKWVEKQIQEWAGDVTAESREDQRFSMPFLGAIPNKIRKTIVLVEWMTKTAKEKGLSLKNIKVLPFSRVTSKDLDDLGAKDRQTVCKGEQFTQMVRGLLEKDVGWYPEKDISAHLDILCKDAVLDVNGSDLGKEAGCTGIIRSFLYCIRRVAIELEDCVLIIPERSLDTQGREAATIMFSDGGVKNCTLLTGAVDYCIVTRQAGSDTSDIDQDTVSDTMQTDPDWPFSRSSFEHYISLVEAKRVYDRGVPVQLENHLPQVIAQCIVSSRAINLGSSEKDILSPVPFVLSNGMNWIFGVVGNAPNSRDQWRCLYSEIRNAVIPVIKRLDWAEVMKAAKVSPSMRVIVDALFAWTCSSATSIYNAMAGLEGSEGSAVVPGTGA